MRSDQEYERPDRGDAGTACHYTSYDTDPDLEYTESEGTDGEVPATGAGATGRERDVWQALYRVEDPEMPVSIVDLGLVYGVDVDEHAGSVDVEMTLTYTGCPAREMLIGSVHEAVTGVERIEECTVRLVWSPPWTVDMVTPYGENALREFGLSV